MGIKVFYKVILSLLMGMTKHFQSTQSLKLAISLQYLKKEVRNVIHFLHAYKRQSFYKLVLLFLMEVARHNQTIQNRKFVIFLQYLKKKVCRNCFCVLLWWKIFRYLRGILQSCSLLLVTTILRLVQEKRPLMTRLKSTLVEKVLFWNWQYCSLFFWNVRVLSVYVFTGGF